MHGSQSSAGRLALIAGICLLAATPLATLAQEEEPPPQQTITDFSPRDIPPDKRVVMSQGTEVVAGVDPATVPHFRVDPFWPKPLPNNWLLGQVAGVDVDRNDHVWIIHRPGSLSDREVGVMLDPPINKCCYPAPPVVEFDRDGTLLRAWGGPGDGYEWPSNEHGIHVDNDGFVWIGGNGEEDNQILKFTADGEFVMQIGASGANQGSNDTENLGRPADMDVDEEANEIYVADGYGNRRVIVFDTETGEYRGHWGAYGNTPHDDELPPYDPEAEPSQQFGSPVHCVRIARDGLIYVCDRVNNRYQVFQKDGTSVSEAFFEPETLLSGSVSDLVLSNDRKQAFIFMVDGVNQEMRIVDRDQAETVARVGRPGRQAGQFHVVHDIAIDSVGNVYTTEVNTGQRAQKFEVSPRRHWRSRRQR
jgi:hypothetical protein